MPLPFFGTLQLLKVYLSCRQTYITQCLEAALAGGGGVNSGAPAGAAASGGSEPGDLDTLTVILGDVLALVCRVVAQAGQLFLQLPGVTAVPLLGKASRAGGGGRGRWRGVCAEGPASSGPCKREHERECDWEQERGGTCVVHTHKPRTVGFCAMHAVPQCSPAPPLRTAERCHFCRC